MSLALYTFLLKPQEATSCKGFQDSFWNAFCPQPRRWHGPQRSQKPCHCQWVDSLNTWLLLIYIYIFFLMWTIFKVVIEFVTILLLLFMFWLFISHWVCGILVPWPGIEPPSLKGELLTIRLPRKSHAWLLKTKNDGEATDTRVLKVMSNFFGKYMMLGSAVSLPTPCYRNKNWDLEQG